MLHSSKAQTCIIPGCEQCQPGLSTDAQKCSKCYDGFILSEKGICVANQCQPWEYLQFYMDSNNLNQQKCVTVCEDSYLANQISKICQNTYQCTNSFSYPTLTNKGQQIKYIYYGTQDELIYIVYSTFMNMIDQYSGSFITSISFPNGVQSISLTQNRLFLLNTNTKQILEWIPTNSITNIVTTVVKGYAKVFSRIYITNANQIVYTSYNDDDSVIYFNVIDQAGKSSSFDEIKLTTPQQTISFFDDFIITQNKQSYQIQVLNIGQKEADQQLSLLGNNQNFYCNQINGQIQEGKYTQFGLIKYYYLIFQNTLSIQMYHIQQSNVVCNNLQMQYQPLKLLLFKAQLCSNQNISSQVLLVSNTNQQILIFYVNEQQQTLAGVLQYQSNVISFNYLMIDQNLLIYALLSNNQIDRRQITFDCSNLQNTQFTQKSLDSLYSLIKNPLNLLRLEVLQKDQTLKNFLILVNQEAQIIDGEKNLSKSIIKDFQDRVIANNGLISKMLYNEKYNFITSCSQDGLIIVWKALDPLQPQYLYQVSLQGQKCMNILDYQSTYIVALYRTHIILFDSNFQLTILDQKFSILNQFTVTIGKVISVKSFEEGKYLFIVQLNQILNYNYYSTIYLDVNSNTQTQIATFFFVTDIVQFKKVVNNNGQNIIILVPLQPLSYTSLTYEVYYTIGQDPIFVPYGRFTYTPTQYVVTAISNKAQSMIITGTQAGQLRVAPMYNDRKLFQIVFNSKSTNQADTINSVYQSFLQGKYFVFTSVISCFSLHTDNFIETITFSTSNEPIQKYQVSDTLNILVACISDEVIIRNFTDPSLKYSLKLTSSTSLLKKINGLFLDENTQELFLYGDGLIKVSSKLDEQSRISQQATLNTDNYQQCLFPQQIVVCIINKQNIVFFDRKSNYSLFQQILLQELLSGGSIALDFENQQVFVYKTYIEVYTFTGSYLKGLSDVLYPIINLNVLDQHIAVMTSAAIYIYLRGSVQYATFISPSGGAFVGYSYIKSQSLIAYYTTQIQYGQILLFSLTTYQQAGFMTNTYQQNKIGQVVKIIYDDDSNMFNYIDVFGNFQNVLNNAQKTTDSTYSIEEIQAGTQPAPINYSVDFKSNTALIYNQQRVWRQNYALFTRPYQRIISRPVNHKFLIKQQDSIYFVIADYQNNIYIYQNYQINFYNYFTLNILDMRQLQRGTQNRFIFFFQSQILIYNDQNTKFQQNSPNKKLTDFQFKRVLLLSSDRLIINTSDNFIVDYDYFNFNLIFKTQLNNLEDITTSLLIGSSISKKWLYIYGTDSGRVGIYDLLTSSLTFVQFKQNIISPIFQIQMYSAQDFICLDNSGIVHMIDSSTYLEFELQPLQQAITQITKQIYDNLTQKVIQLIQFDLNNQRTYINFQSERYILIISLKDYSLIQYLSFPDNEWKQIVMGNQYLLICSFFQINIYLQQNLSFIGYARRYNRRDRITDIRLIDENKIIAVFVNRIESLYIQAQTGSIILVDSLVLNDSQLLYVNLITAKRIVNYIGVASNTIYEKKINYGFYENSQSVAPLSSNANCNFQIQYKNYITSLTYFQQIYSTTSLSFLYLLSVYIGNYIDNLAFLKQKSLNIVFRPQNYSQNNLQILSNSFENMSFDVIMESFSLNLTKSQQAIKLNQNSKNIILQSITLSDQILQQDTQIQFDQKTNIILNGVVIKNLELVTNVRVLQQSDQEQIDTKYYLFNFTNCQNLTISNMEIDNLNISATNQNLIYSMKTQQIIVRNLKIQNSIFSSLIDIFQSTNVTFENISIINCQNNFAQQNAFFMQFIGIISLEMKSLEALHNRDIQIFQTDKSYDQQNQGTIVLSIDTLKINGSYIFNNTFPETKDKLNIQNNLIKIQSTFVSMYNFDFESNEGNIILLGITKIQISDSKFKSNIGVNGGGIYAEDIKQEFVISNTTFFGNKVTGNGGSIYLNKVNHFIIDQQSSILGSQASIGGALRIKNEDINLWKKYTINCLLIKNKAEIYGNNIGTLPLIFKVLQSANQEQSSFQILIYEGNLNNMKNPINFQNQQSGGLFQFKIELQDEEQRSLSVNLQKYKSNQYEQTILNELNSYYIQVEINQNATSLNKQNSIIELKGQSLIGIKQYDETTKMFSYDSLTLTSQPLLSISSVNIQFSFNSLGYSAFVPTQITFRPCKQGEILVSSQTQISLESNQQSSITLVACQECTQGMYSLIDPQEDYNQYLQTNDLKLITSQVCKQCPNQVQNCIGNQMTLLDGYWRFSKQTDEILECNFMNPLICSEQSNTIEGCIEGYVGPICEKCDTTGQTWGKRYAQSFQQYQCSECSDQFYQKTLFIISSIVIFIYLYFSIFLFMGRYTYESLCNYVRILKLLPFSRSCTLDESSYYMKILINYLQLSSLLFSFNTKFLPTFLSSVPTFAGSPSSRLMVSTQCLFSLDMYKDYGEEKVMIVGQSLYPIINLVFLYLLLAAMNKFKLKEVGQYHKYTMFNIVFLFFQPDCISFFTKALACRQIGDQKFLIINTQVKCEDESYNEFSYAFVLPNLLIWVFMPLVQMYYLKKSKGTKNENIDKCILKYKFGFFFVEFKPKYYYWEFCRMYLKIIIIIITTILNDYQDSILILCIIIIFSYALIVIKQQPFKSHSLFRQEMISYLLLIPCIFLFYLYRQYPYQIFQILIALIHYTYVSCVIMVIIKFKLDNQTSRANKALKYLIQKICCKYVIVQLGLIKKEQDGRCLMNWRKVYLNLTKIKIENINNNLNKLQSQMLNKSLSQSLAQAIKQQNQERTQLLIQVQNMMTSQSKNQFNQYSIKDSPQLSYQNSIFNPKAKSNFCEAMLDSASKSVTQRVSDSEYGSPRPQYSKFGQEKVKIEKQEDLEQEDLTESLQTCFVQLTHSQANPLKQTLEMKKPQNGQRKNQGESEFDQIIK